MSLDGMLNNAAMRRNAVQPGGVDTNTGGKHPAADGDVFSSMTRLDH